MNAIIDELSISASGLTERLLDGWALLEQHLPPVEAQPTADTALEWNSRLAGAAKFALTSDFDFALSAELPATAAEEEVASQLRATTMTGFAAALNLWTARPSVSPTLRCVPAFRAEGATSALLAALSKSSWSATAQSDAGTLMIGLDERENTWKAQVLQSEGDSAGQIVLFAEVAEIGVISGEPRTAISRFLLAAGGQLRWARPALRQLYSRQVVGLEVLLPSADSAELLDEAISVLAVGCRLFGQEGRELLQEPTAQGYLHITSR